MTAREVLIKTRRLFTSGKWTRGTMHRTINDEDYYCLVGGIRATSGFDFRYGGWKETDGRLAYHEARTALAQVVPNGDIVSYNDRHGRKVEDVIEKIDLALEKV